MNGSDAPLQTPRKGCKGCRYLKEEIHPHDDPWLHCKRFDIYLTDSVYHRGCVFYARDVVKEWKEKKGLL